MTDKETALVPSPSQHLRPAARSFSLMPNTLGEAMELAKLIATSDMAPKGYEGKPANVLIAIQMGADVGLKPMQALQNIAVINGRPSIWGDAALGLVQASGEMERFQETLEGDGAKMLAVCLGRRKGFPDEIRRTFSVEDAKAAGLWGKSGPWSTYPKRMLQMRARSWVLRDGFADILVGLNIAEEALDMTPIDVTATRVEEVTDHMARVPEALRDNLEKAFETLSMPAGARLAKINEFLGKDGITPEEGATALLEWCKDEYSRRKTGMPRKEKAAQPIGNGKTPAAEAAATGPVTVNAAPSVVAPTPAPPVASVPVDPTQAMPKAAEIPWGSGELF